ncbi:FGGY family carbohydrate kinase [Croceicoccus mobilis]|uniref:ATP:glycerol 3-phosphotransferase n=1 Tax=Croceicoccus mobilis TaxID=1703339 RepID=A0A916YRS9_9SPHN|nr:FGGY family carbohydrate kinase [Croceicoccus mobilis]GGD57726.1 glycerol kinase [Croceicoccus mobilis]
MSAAANTAPCILAIDQGTTNTKVLLVDGKGDIRLCRSRCVPLSYPRPGWVEQSADAIWLTVKELILEVLSEASGADIAAIAISNQRETVILWNRHTGEPIAPAVTWQCTRSAGRCDRLRKAGKGPFIAQRSGLGIDPLFPAAKIAGMLDAEPELRKRADKGEILFGTVDSWLVWNLTGGAVHATDHSNASRTQLFNIGTAQWDEELADVFDVPLAILPQAMPSDSYFGATGEGLAPLRQGTPIHSVLGDSHAALFAHDCLATGVVKVTIGTGSSLMAAVPARLNSHHGLSDTIAWSRENSGIQHALEGNISVSGHAAAFAAKLMGLPDAKALSDLAGQVSDSEGVIFVPALAGLGAPHWRTDARGTIAGMSLATRPAHLARATLEAIAHQICDVIEAMEGDLGHPFPSVTIDGGGAQNSLLAQILADLSGKIIVQPQQAESSALGVALMAAQAIGIVQSVNPPPAQQFTPQIDGCDREHARRRWKEAIAQVTEAASQNGPLGSVAA